MDYIQDNRIKHLAEKSSTEEVMICVISKSRNSTFVLGRQGGADFTVDEMHHQKTRIASNIK